MKNTSTGARSTRSDAAPRTEPAAIRRDEWLRALRAAGDAELAEEDGDAVTVMEFAALIGMQRSAAEERLRRLLRSGLAEKARKRIRRTDGALITVTAYRLVAHAGTDRQ